MVTHDPIAVFDGKSISYTYDNGWSFTNPFDGDQGTQILTGHVTNRDE